MTATTERVGRVRDIEWETGRFAAVLNGAGQKDPEVVGWFPIELVASSDHHRLEIGVGFTLATSRRALVSDDGHRAKPSLQTTIVLHRPPPMSQSRREQARATGRSVRSQL